MAFVTEEQPPESFSDDQREYLNRIISQINIGFSTTDILPKRTDLNFKPVIGKLYFFSNAAPSEPAITGEGYWGFTSTGWVQLG